MKRGWKDYRDFHINFERLAPGVYQVEAQGPAGEARSEFRIPFDAKDLKIFLLEVGRPRSVSSRGSVPEPLQPTLKFGQDLYNSVFTAQVRDLYIASRTSAKSKGNGLRLRLRFNESPELANLPWEFLNDGRDFIALSDDYPLVRYLDLPSPPRPASVDFPLRILVTVSAPLDLPPLDVEAEKQRLLLSLKTLVEDGRVEVHFTPDASLKNLQRTLRRARSMGQPFHIWHYIGHGVYDPQVKASVLSLTNERGASDSVSGFQLGTLFDSYPEVRLVLLNACEGARSSIEDPFSGVAAALVESGIPAVIAMQFEISDQAAIVLAEEFYAALVDGLPIDSALTEARRAVFFLPNWVEWATPVLFLRAPDGVLFEFSQVPPVKKAAQTADLAVLSADAEPLIVHEEPSQPQPEPPAAASDPTSQPASRSLPPASPGDVKEETRRPQDFTPPGTAPGLAQPAAEPVEQRETTPRAPQISQPTTVSPDRPAASPAKAPAQQPGWRMTEEKPRSSAARGPAASPARKTRPGWVVPGGVGALLVLVFAVLALTGVFPPRPPEVTQAPPVETEEPADNTGVVPTEEIFIPPIDRSTIYVDDTASGANDGTSWTDAFTSLQDALSVAENGSRIWVAQGIYVPGDTPRDTFKLQNGVELLGGFSGVPGSEAGGPGDNDSARDMFAFPTVLSGDIEGDDERDTVLGLSLADGIVGPNSYHVVDASETDASAVLEGFYITGGSAVSANWPDDSGGGILVDSGSPTFRSLLIQGNHAVNNGGGIANYDSSPDFYLVTLDANTARSGGGMFNSASSPNFRSGLFQNNRSEIDGGGMYNVFDSQAQLTDVSFISNSASTSGGGMVNYFSSPSLVRVQFGYNQAGSGGGGISFEEGTPSLVDVTFWENTPSDMQPICLPDGSDVVQFSEDLGEITIYIVNDTSRNVSVIHVDSFCEEFFYAELSPGDSYEQGTYAPHRWKFSDAQTGEPLLSAIASFDYRQITVREP